MPDQHYRIDRLGKSLQPFEQLLFRGGVELWLDLDYAALAERRLNRLERLASAKRGRAEDKRGADPLPPNVLGNLPRTPRSPRGASGRSMSARVESNQLDFACRSRMTVLLRDCSSMTLVKVSVLADPRAEASIWTG